MVYLGPLCPLPEDYRAPDWSIMGNRCTCWRRNCRHERDLEHRRSQRRILAEQLAALTDEDRAWLAEMGWQPPQWDTWIDSERVG